MRTRTIDGMAVLIPDGKLVAGEEIDRLEVVLKRLSSKGVYDVIIDCSSVRRIDGVGLGVLISGYSNFVRRGGRFMLACVNKKLENAFTITKLALVFDVYPTVDEAITALSKPQPKSIPSERSPK